MKIPEIPSAEVVRATLCDLTAPQLRLLAKLSRVPLRTIHNVRSGLTGNPGIETAGAIMRCVGRARAGRT
jgi:hypothetical protein